MNKRAFLKTLEEKIHTQNHGNFQIRIWQFRGQDPHCKDLALTMVIGRARADPLRKAHFTMIFHARVVFLVREGL